MTNKEAISNLNHIYGMVAPDIQRSLDVAIKALERPQGEWIYERPNGKTYSDFVFCSVCHKHGGFNKTNFCPNCGASMKKGGAT